MKDKIKHWWYTYIKNDPKKSPYYNTKYEISKRVLKRLDIKPNKIYGSNDTMLLSASIDMFCGDVVFVMSKGKTPTEMDKSYMIDAHNFLHIQFDGVGYRQHMWVVPYKYFHEDEEHIAKFDEDMLVDIIDRLTAIVNEN